MSKELPLTLAFINQRPLAAGRELATMRAEEAAIFLEAIPTRSAAPVLAGMGAWIASCVLSKMSVTSAAAVLGMVDYLDAAAILRNLTVTQRRNMLSELPTKLARDLETSLVFPDSTVGAYMTTAFMTLTEQHVIGDAIDLIQHSENFNADVMLIVDADRKLAGAVTTLGLLQYPGNTPLSEIMDRTIEPVSARSRLSAITELAAWDDYTALPVISRKKDVIGLLLRKAVRHADDHRNSFRSRPTASIPILMLDAFIVSTVGITQALVGTETSITIKARASNE